MSDPYTKFDQALMDLVEAYTELESDTEEKFGDDPDAYESALIETLETSIDSTVEEQGVSTNVLAALFNQLSEALEQYDPSAFADDEDDEDIDYSITTDLDDDDDDDEDDALDLDDED